VNGQSVEPTEKSKKNSALFFAFTYGVFNAGYLIALIQISSGAQIGNLDTGVFTAGAPASVLVILAMSLMFFVNHLYSFLYNKDNYRGIPNIGTMTFFPYARIFPMHLTIIIGAYFGQGAIIIFLLFKTIADVIMHAVEHSLILAKE